MPNRNLSAPFSMTTAILTGLPALGTSGIIGGANLASNASTNSSAALAVNMSKRDSLLAALDALLKFPEEKNVEIPSLNLFPELKDSFISYLKAVAAGSSALGVAPVSLLTNISQLPLDVTAAIQGILSSVQHPGKFTRPDATTLNEQAELLKPASGFSANCRALSKELEPILNQLDENIDNNIGKGNFAATHGTAAKTGISIPVSGTVTVAGLVSLGLDSIGSIFREITALGIFSQHESHSEEGKKNVYDAFNDCCVSFTESKDSQGQLRALRNLEMALSNFEQANDIRKAHSVSSPVISVVTRILTSQPFLAVLRSVNSSAIALEEANKALSKEEKALSQPLDVFSAKASSLNYYANGGLQNSQNVNDLSNNFARVSQNLAQELDKIEVQSDRTAIGSSGVSTLSLSLALSLVPSLVTDFVGMLSREMSGAFDFTQNDKGTRQESAQVAATRKDQSGADLDALMARASQLAERLERCHQLGVSAPVTLGLSHIVTCGGLIATLNSAAGMYFAVRELQSMGQSPSAPTKLDEEEMKQAQEYKDAVIASNNKSANSMGTQQASENLSLNQQLQSVMEKVVLIHRSKLNPFQPGMERNDVNSSGKSTIALSQENSSGFLSGALGALALVSVQSGIGVEAFFRLLGMSSVNLDRSSDGADKTRIGEHLQLNMSAVSNISRLSAEQKSSLQTVSKSSYLASEFSVSRSLIMALCNSGALKQALRALTAEEKARVQELGHIPRDSHASINVMDKLADKIVEVLNQANEGQRPMFGLNQDMASQMASASKSSIVSALTAHSSLVAPFLQISEAFKVAVQTEDAAKNEALSKDNIISAKLSEGMNVIQAFTRNSMNAFTDDIDNLRIDNLDADHSAINTHLSSNKTNAGLFAASMLLSLLCEELFEMALSRSFSLLDANKISASSQLSKNESKLNAEKSALGVSDDSNLAQGHNLSSMLTALRLILSRLGQSLVGFAAELQEKSQKNGNDLLQANLKMHTSQQTFLRLVSNLVTQISLTLSQTSGAFSMLPLTAVGTIDDLRHFIHSIDPELEFERVDSSADSSQKEDSLGTSLISGISIDSTGASLLNLTKMLLRASLLGSDISLSIAKILEILSLHQRPEQALALETKAASMFNDSNVSQPALSQSIVVGGIVSSASLLDESKSDAGSSQVSTMDSVRSLQQAVDKEIDKFNPIADPEENAEDVKKGLKSFYETMIRVLAQHSHLVAAGDNDYKDIATRFSRGGIGLSSFHSAHGSVTGASDNASRNGLINKDGFMRCDDAQGLLATFIYKAAQELVPEQLKQDCLLIKLKHALPRPQDMTEASKHLWKHIIDQVSSKLYTAYGRNKVFDRNSPDFNSRVFHNRMATTGPLPALAVIVNEDMGEPLQVDEVVAPPQSFRLGGSNDQA